MKTRIALSAIAAILVTGCATPPATELTIGTSKLTSPKQMILSNLVVNLPDGSTLKADYIHAYNEADVLSALAAQNVAQSAQLLEALKLLQNLAAKGALAP